MKKAWFIYHIHKLRFSLGDFSLPCIPTSATYRRQLHRIPHSNNQKHLEAQFFPEILCRRLPLSRSINFNYHPSSIHFSISFADLAILYSARSLRDLSTIQILAATPQQTRLISRRLSWEDPDLFINIHNMHIGTHTFYKYIQYWHWKYK